MTNVEVNPTQCSHLKGIQMNDRDNKAESAIQVITGAFEYAQIKTKWHIRIENIGKPVPKYKAFGWTIIFHRRETTQNHMMLARIKEPDYADLC